MNLIVIIIELYKLKFNFQVKQHFFIYPQAWNLCQSTSEIPGLKGSKFSHFIKVPQLNYLHLFDLILKTLIGPQGFTLEKLVQWIQHPYPVWFSLALP